MQKYLYILLAHLTLYTSHVHAENEHDGAHIYQFRCSVCHATGIAGAPQVGDKTAWQQRLAQRSLKEIQENMFAGFGGMPARGACAGCSDDELKATLDYMLKASQIVVPN